jgi:hypothetical protein
MPWSAFADLGKYYLEHIFARCSDAVTVEHSNSRGQDDDEG